MVFGQVLKVMLCTCQSCQPCCCTFCFVKGCSTKPRYRIAPQVVCVAASSVFIEHGPGDKVGRDIHMSVGVVAKSDKTSADGVQRRSLRAHQGKAVQGTSQSILTAAATRVTPFAEV